MHKLFWDQNCDMYLKMSVVLHWVHLQMFYEIVNKNMKRLKMRFMKFSLQD